MATAMAAGAAPSPAASTGAGAGAQNPFYLATNLYSEKMFVDSQQLGASTTSIFHQVNAGNFMRGVRLLVRSTGGVGGTPTADNPVNIWSSLDLQNVDGGEIIYPMPGFNHLVSQLYFRPWLGDPRLAYDWAQSINPSFTLFLQPEIRYGAGALNNTDSRSQYKFNQIINSTSSVIASNTTAPTVSVTSYLDAWAQPDATDLHGVPNQPIPPGVNLQMKRRRQPVNLLGAGTDNIFQLNLTGNELRAILAVVRDNNNVRQDYLSDPIRWMLDNRPMGVFSPDMLFQWTNNFYSPYAIGSRPTGVYVFARFLDPGNYTGQSWLATTDATKITFESVTLATASNVGSGSTLEFITDEVYPVAAFPPELAEI